MKKYSKFVCQQCAYESASWLGKCPNCGSWNSFAETVVSAQTKNLELRTKNLERPQRLSEIKSIEKGRIKTGFEELDRVLGGGVVPGSIILLAGDPGIGKSTLLLQVAASLGGSASALGDRPGGLGGVGGDGKDRFHQAKRSTNSTKRSDQPIVLYVCGEESPEQIKIRSQRLQIKSDHLLLLPQTDVDTIVAQIEEIKPLLVVIDSIQTLTTSDLSGTAGSVGQVRESAARLSKVGKTLGIPIFLIGHVTKEGAIAGPMVLEHLVDTILFLEGERFYPARTLRSFKNRFGPTDEVGIFQMEEGGLVEVKNPSELFLQEREKETPGSVVVPILEGTRPILVEIQALVTPTSLAFPRRIASGFDPGRLNILAAVVSKRLGLPLQNWDIFINVPGGLKLREPATDLGVALAIISSFKGKALPFRSFVFGEVGLLGEVRRVQGEEKRIKEARRLGFGLPITPANCKTLASASQKFLH